MVVSFSTISTPCSRFNLVALWLTSTIDRPLSWLTFDFLDAPLPSASSDAFFCRSFLMNLADFAVDSESSDSS